MTLPPPSHLEQVPTSDEVIGLVRGTVRSLLLSCPAFQKLNSDERRALAESMVKVSHTAAVLIREEMKATRTMPHASRESFPRTAARDLEVETFRGPEPIAPAAPRTAARGGARTLVAQAQAAGDKFSGVAADRVAGTTRSILNAVSFPRFVTELITGVFRALVDSTQDQMNSYVQLLGNVAATTEGFADIAMSNLRARQWLADQFPGSFEVVRDEDEEFEPGQPAPESKLRLRSGASSPSAEALRSALGIPSEQSMPSGDPEQTLVPFAKLALARQRQQMLATLVMLGMQRIVIESGRINASMRFHIDTRSAAQEDDASRFALDNEIKASGSFGFGPWGASASVRNNIAYVSTQKTQTTEEMNTDLDLNSSVELYFKSDYLPLDRLAGGGQQDRIRANTLNPEAEGKIAAEARTARLKSAGDSDAARRTALDKDLMPGFPPAAKDEDPVKGGAAEKARPDAANRTAKMDGAAKPKPPASKPEKTPSKPPPAKATQKK